MTKPLNKVEKTKRAIYRVAKRKFDKIVKALNQLFRS